MQTNEVGGVLTMAFLKALYASASVLSSVAPALNACLYLALHLLRSAASGELPVVGWLTNREHISLADISKA